MSNDTILSSKVSEWLTKKGCSRRLSTKSEYEIKPAYLSQPIDIDISLLGKATNEIKNMPDYPMRSVENSLEYIEDILSNNIRSVVLRVVGNSKEHKSIEDLMYQHAQAVQHIRNYFPKKELDLKVDPFSVALNSDGTWGIKGTENNIDYWKTSELISTIAHLYSDIKVDSLLTLGRIENEVEITKKILTENNSDTRIISFSQNTETANAYIYLDHIKSMDTGQKILVGNLTEMLIRTLIDIHEGADAIIVKPIENLHLINLTTQFIKDKRAVVDFLTSNSITRMVEENPQLESKFVDMIRNTDSLFKKCQKVKVGTYTVSGTYHLQKNLKNERMTFGAIDELLKNAISICEPCLENIIDRNALWYVKKQRELGLVTI